MYTEYSLDYGKVISYTNGHNNNNVDTKCKKVTIDYFNDYTIIRDHKRQIGTFYFKNSNVPNR